MNFPKKNSWNSVKNKFQLVSALNEIQVANLESKSLLQDISFKQYTYAIIIVYYCSIMFLNAIHLISFIKNNYWMKYSRYAEALSIYDMASIDIVCMQMYANVQGLP